jgi:predicted esterase
MVQQHYLGRTLDIQEKTLRQGLLQTPILLEHSRDDTVIPVSNGQYICQVLKELGFSAVEWHEYEDGGHWFNEPHGVDEFAAFLRRGMSAR